VLEVASSGLSPERSTELAARFADTLFSAERRAAWLERFFTTPSGRAKPDRYWKIDLDALDLRAVEPVPDAGTSSVSGPRHDGVIACSFEDAVRMHGDLLRRAIERDAAFDRFGALARAFARTGIFIHAAAGVELDEPFVVAHTATGRGAFFPATVIVLEAGARISVIERLAASQDGAFVCALGSSLLGEGASLESVALQELPADARCFVSRAAFPGRSARLHVSEAHLGAGLAVATTAVALEEPGAHAEVDLLLFPHRSQHVDAVTRIDHRCGETTSRTQVRSAAAGEARARYVGTIAIVPGAQRSDAGLRDDALVLSPRAHIESVPALEIGANDVRAYHGAAIGALDEEMLFYATSRGIPRDDAERMIALGFFEPLIERIAFDEIRDELRRAVAERVG